MYLPPYSPDLNPIEEAFSKIKGIVRKRSQEPGGIDRSDGQCARRDHVPGRERLLRALRAPSTGSTVMIDAVEPFGYVNKRVSRRYASRSFSLIEPAHGVS